MDQAVYSDAASRMRELLARMQGAVAGNPPPSLAHRDANLRRIETLVMARQEAIADAIAADFGNRSRVETVMAEVLPTAAAAVHARRHLPGWMRTRRRAVGVNFRPAMNRIEYVPKGVMGIVAPWNYPVFLTLGPLVDVLAAGNRAIIKPSEYTPATSRFLAEALGEIFPEDEVAVVEGGPEVARAFVSLPFDHLLYTGSTAIGREVMRAAAENLTPVTLELGGKSPVIVADDYDVGKAARSVAVGKFFNAGQTCTAPDYALVGRERAASFGEGVIAAAEAMFPTLAGNGDYTAIISDRHFARIKGLVDEAEAAGARVVRHRAAAEGGNVRHFPPTVVIDPPPESGLLREEIFGPVLPVVGVGSEDEALDYVAKRPRPLAFYAYTNKPQTERKLLDRSISGGVTINGTLVHTGQEDLPFGGIGPSGMGAYHAREGFYEFSHARAVHKVGFFSGFEFLRPPHGRRTRTALRFLAGSKPGKG